MMEKEWLVTAREHRTFTVDYFVRAETAEEARELVKAGRALVLRRLVSAPVDNEEANLESVYSQEILCVQENK